MKKVQTSRRRLLQGVLALLTLSALPFRVLAGAAKAFEAFISGLT